MPVDTVKREVLQVWCRVFDCLDAGGVEISDWARLKLDEALNHMERPRYAFALLRLSLSPQYNWYNNKPEFIPSMNDIQMRFNVAVSKYDLKIR